MKFYDVILQFERTQTIRVQADSKADARELVQDGEFGNDQIIDTEDDYVDIVGVSEADDTLKI